MVGPFGLPRRQPAASEPWLSYPAYFSASARCSHLRTSAPGSCVRAGTLPCLGLCRAACSEEEPPSFYSPKPLPPEAAPPLPVLWLAVPGCFPPLSRQGLHWRRHWLGRVAPPECRRRWGGVEPLVSGGPHPPAFLLHSSLGPPGPPGPGRAGPPASFPPLRTGGLGPSTGLAACAGCGWDLSFLA